MSSEEKSIKRNPSDESVILRQKLEIFLKAKSAFLNLARKKMLNYSQRPKSERSVIGQRRNPSDRSCGSDFGRSGCSVHFIAFKRSDFGYPTKLDRFIYKGGHKNYIFIYKMV